MSEGLHICPTCLSCLIMACHFTVLDSEKKLGNLFCFQALSLVANFPSSASLE